MDSNDTEMVIEFDMAQCSELRSWLESPDDTFPFEQYSMEQPHGILTMLISFIRFWDNSDHRTKAAKHLRQLLDPSSELFLWPLLPPKTETLIQRPLLQMLSEEIPRSVLSEVRLAVLRLGHKLLPEGRWPSLVPFIFGAMADPSPVLKESGLFLCAHLVEQMDISLLPPSATLRTILYCSLTDSSSERQNVRYAGLLAAVSLLRWLPRLERDKSYYLFRLMIPILVEASTNNEDFFVKEAVEYMTVLFPVGLTLNRQLWTDIVEAMLKIAGRTGLEGELRSDVVNLVIILIDTREQTSGHTEALMLVTIMIKHLKPFTGQFVAILLQMLSDIKDNDTYEDNNFKHAKKYSNIFSAILGGDLLDVSMVELLPAYLADPDWKKRHAALVFLKEISKGCYEAMSRILSHYMKMVEKLLEDIHPRVQVAAVDAMCVLLIGLKPDLHAKYHNEIIPDVILAMKKVNWPRVQEEAATAALNFCYCNNDIFQIYLKDLLDASLTMIFRGNAVVQGNVLITLGSLAYLLEDALESVYKYVMGRLKSFLKDAINNVDRILSAKLMKCIYVIGAFLGEDGFRDDAKEVMKELISSRASFWKADDAATGYVLKAWKNLFKCVGWDSSSNMDLVMPSSPQSAQSVLELAVSSTNLDNTWTKMGKDAGEKLGTEVGLLDQKVLACDIICCYADVLKEDFYPWIDQVATFLLPLLKLKFHKKVRKAAHSAISKLLSSAKLRMPDDFKRSYEELINRCDEIIPSFIEALHKEYDTERCGEMLDSLLSEVLKRAHSERKAECNRDVNIQERNRSKSCEF